MIRPALTILALLAAAAPVRAAGVVGTGTPASCTEAAFAAALAGGGTVTFDCGPTLASIPLTSEKVVTASTTIDGGGRILLSGQDQTRLFRVPPAVPGVALTIRAAHLSNGRCPLDPPAALPGFGGAIVAGIGSQVTLRDVDLSLNTCNAPAPGAGGGAVHIRGGALTLIHVSGIGNSGSDGTIVNSLDSPVFIEDASFTSNTPTRRGGLVYAQGSGGGLIVVRRAHTLVMNAPAGGGAVYATFGPGDQGLLVDDSALNLSSVSSGDGGAIYVEGGAATINGSTFSGNHARRGAAVFAKDTALTVSNSTFASNWAHEAAPGDGNGIGGALFLAGTVTGSIQHSTFAANRADAAAGAIGGSGPSPLVLRASLLGFNSAGNPLVVSGCSVALASGGFNIQQPGPASDLDCAPGILRGSPGLLAFVNSGTGHFPLASDSPARDLVTSGCPPPAVDQRGVVRPTGPACDAGSYEWAPQITVQNASLYEGNSGSAPMTFTVRLSEAAAGPVTVAYSTGPEGDATPGVDYLSAAGVVTFPPGVTERPIDVSILGDAVTEPTEFFTFRLSAPTGAVLGNVDTYGAIIDDDTPPTISVTGCNVGESIPTCTFTVRMNIFNGAPVTVQYETARDTATAGADFQATSGTLTFAPGTAEASVDVPIFQDSIDETIESFALNLSAPQNGTIGIGTALGVISDDDGPRISIGDASSIESFGGQHTVSLDVRLSAPSPETITVTYSPRQGTALPDLDYFAAGGTVTFPPGEVSRTALAVVLGDTLDEPDERFRVVLLPPGNATVAEGGGVVTIVDDDGVALRPAEMAHGTSLSADLVDGPDLYTVHQPPYSSWEVVLDEASGDLGAGSGPRVERLSPDLTTVLGASVPVGAGRARSLRWVHEGTQWERDDYVRILSEGCGPDCGPDDTYRVRAYETTLRSARFNCADGQSSVLVLQNAGPATIQTWPHFWAPNGSLSASAFRVIDPRGVLAADICQLPGIFVGQSGSVTVVHDGAYGLLTGKVVQVDAATGASFDTPLTARPR